MVKNDLEEETEEDRIVRWKPDDDGGCSRDCPCRNDILKGSIDNDEEIGYCIILSRTLAVKVPCPVLRLRWALKIDDLWERLQKKWRTK